MAGLDQLRVVLVRTRNPVNIGAVARAMSNFGFEHLRVVNPYDVAFREARSAMSAAQLLESAEEYTSVADAVADCTLVVGTASVTYREPCHQVHRLEDAGRLLRSHVQSGKAALLFGSEKVGLSNRDLSHCHWLLRIPTREDHSSMNLAQAVAVCLYELVRVGEGAVEIQKLTAAPAGELDRITEGLLDILCTSGYMKSASPSAEEKIRRMVRRLNLDERDAELWLGILRQIAWKVKTKQ
jgi:TrmH family RNA methyltransferase